MIGIAIQVLWLLIGVIVLGGIIFFAIYVIKTVIGPQNVPPRIEQAVWLIFLILILIAVLTLIAGGSIGGIHLALR